MHYEIFGPVKEALIIMDLQKLFSWIFQTSKVFDCIDPNLRIAKLHAYGLSVDALGLIYDYLSNRKQRVKIND